MPFLYLISQHISRKCERINNMPKISSSVRFRDKASHLTFCSANFHEMTASLKNYGDFVTMSEGSQWMKSLGTVLKGLKQSVGFLGESSSLLFWVDLDSMVILGVSAEEYSDLEVASGTGISVEVVFENTRHNLLHFLDEVVCLGSVTSASTVLDLDHVVSSLVSKNLIGLCTSLHFYFTFLKLIL